MKRLFAWFVIGAIAVAGVLSPTEVNAQNRAIIVDHTSVALFDRIPDQYITAARNLRMIYFDKSVGANISAGLDCLAYPSVDAAPVGCKKPDPVTGQPPGLVANAKYNRSNWRYQWWPSSGCGGWTDLVNCFNSQANPVAGQYDILSFQFSYLEMASGSTIANNPGGFFSDNKAVNDVNDYNAFAASHPGKKLIYWTSSVARGIGTPESTSFNNQMRQYARSNNKILFDVADIESHSPSGAPCYDNRDGVQYCEPDGRKCENFPNDNANHPAICTNYTTEMNGGHLNSVAKVRLAKAFWVLMAQIAGWVP